MSPGPWALRSLGLADLVAPKGQRGGQTAPKVSDARSAGSQVEPCPDPRPASEEGAFHPGPWPARELGRRQGMRAGPRESGHTLVHPTGPPEPPYGRERTPPQPVKPQPGPKLQGCTGGQMPALGPSSSLRPAVTFWGSLRGFTAPCHLMLGHAGVGGPEAWSCVLCVLTASTSISLSRVTLEIDGLPKAFRGPGWSDGI